MKKFSIKKLLVATLAGACCACVGLSVSLLNDGVDTASAATATSETSTFEIIGASVRKMAPDGLRFVAQAEEDVLTAGAEYGMVLIPQDMDTGADLTKDTANALVIPATGVWSDELCTTYGIEGGYKAFSCALIAEQVEGEGVARFPEEFYDRPITAVAYVTADGETVYTEKVTRSMSYVATVESLKPEYETNELIEGIVSKATVEFSVNGGEALTSTAAYAPSLTIGGVSATESSLLSVTYTSNNESVAKIVDGKVQAVADGSATITATATAGGEKTFTATTEISVNIARNTVTVASNIAAAGTVSGTDDYEQGKSATVTATTINDDYYFLGWYEGDNKVSDSATYTFTVTADITLTAKWSAIIGMDTEYWGIGNTQTTSISNGTLTFTETADGDSVYTKSSYTNFILQYDVSGLRADNFGWFGVCYGATVTAPVYHHNTNNFVHFQKEGWNAIYWYTDDKSVLNENNVPVYLAGTAISEKLLTDDSVNVKAVVSGGVAVFTLTFADGTTVSSQEIPCQKGMTTTGYVAIPATISSTYTVENLQIIDLDGRDFNPAPTEVNAAMKDLKEAGQVKINGRTHFDENNALVLRNSASGFEVYTTSSKLSMSASASTLIGAVPEENFTGEFMKIKVWVDGVEKVIDLTSLTTIPTEVVLAENMQAGVQHHIKVAKMNEAYVVYSTANSNLFVHDLTCLSDGAIMQAPAVSSLKLEVYGDSITCGYGALGNVTDNPGAFRTEEEDATVTYAYKTAQALGADINVIAHQGWAIGQSRWTEDTTKPLTLPAIYDKVTAAHDVAWDFTSYTPDIVIINLGTNDKVYDATVSATDINYTNYCWQYLAFIHALHAKYPNAKFALCYGMMNPAGDAMETAVKEWLTAACRDGIYDTQKSVWVYESIANVIAVDLTGADGMYMSGGGAHPSAAEHTKAATNLQTALQAAGWVS